MTIEWKDATSYSQGQRGKIDPTAWEIRFEGARVWISKAHRYYPGKWVLKCREAGIEDQEICPASETTPLSAVQESALKFVAVVMRQKAEKLTNFLWTFIKWHTNNPYHRHQRRHGPPVTPRKLKGNGMFDEITEYLTTTFYLDMGITPRQWDFTDLTYNVTRMDATSRQLAERALDAWAEVSTFTFTETDGPAHLTFWVGRPVSGTYFALSEDGATILSADVHQSHWLALSDADWRFQNFTHEIGHALGLGHPGNYNGSASEYLFEQDVWDFTVMSYRGDRNVTGPQEVDIAALWSMYGRPDAINAGDTLHTVRGDLHSHIIDDSGTDTIRLKGDGVIDMRLGSATDTLSLGENTEVEAVYFDDGATVEIIGSAGDDIIGVWG